ncbi:tetraspanin-2A [Hyalella azteca]|uniref:Tetraspanin n=1 Tax=Hyalella azteca TaxID=294128 RepID=A0A8B7NWG4_HYAAZ|nr:tetraspanin-2A [Hyalella azteca]
MDYDDEDEYSLYHMGTAERAGRTFMYSFNTLFFVAGSCMFSMGLFVQFDEGLKNSLGFLDFPEYYTANIIIMVGSTILMLGSVAGLVGTSYSNYFLLLMYLALSVISFSIDLGGAVYLLCQGLEATHAYPSIKETFQDYMYRYQYDMVAKYRVDVIQEYIGCCGAALPSDWVDIHMPVPNTCRNQITGNQYKNSCAEIMSRSLELYTGITSGLTLCICFLQLFTFIFVACIYRGVKQRQRAIKSSIIKR